MKFAKYGRTIQLSIQSADDLRDVLALDESHWVSTSAPVTGFRCNAGFLGMLDSDKNGRINSDEVRAAISWTLDRLANCCVLPTTDQSLPLDAVKADTDAGKALIDSARYVLQAQNAETEDTIALQQVQTFVAGIEARPLNGNGIVPPEAADDPNTASFIQTVIDAGWGTPDIEGRTGIGQAQLQGFLDGLPAYLEWRRQGSLDSPEESSEVKPFGEKTADLYGILQAQSDRVETFFRLCHVLQFDARASTRVGGADSALETLDPTQRQAVDSSLEKLPIAKPTVEAELPLDETSVNPLYHDWLAQFRESLVKPILGNLPDSLQESDWHRIKAAFAPYENYVAQRPATFTDAVPLECLQACLESSHRDAALRLMAKDAQVATVLQNAKQVEQLLLYTTYLLEFVNNFVSFPYLYSAEQRAMFEVGSAVLDGRWFTFAVRVDDMPAHATVAKTGHLFIMYLEVTAPNQPAFTVAVPVTSGSKGNLTVGKRGVFFDCSRHEFDARITNVLENPISVREALATPFVKLWQLAQGKIESWSTAAEKNLQTEFNKTVEASKQPPPAPAPAPQQGLARQTGMFLGLGVTVAALGSAFAFISKTLAGMTPLHVLFSLGAAAAVVILPVALVAILKLRQQDLSVLLEGCGWAINARMRLNRQQRRQFTRYAPYPAGAKGVPRGRAFRLLLFILLIIAALTAVLRTCRSIDQDNKPVHVVPPPDLGETANEPHL